MASHCQQDSIGGIAQIVNQLIWRRILMGLHTGNTIAAAAQREINKQYFQRKPPAQKSDNQIIIELLEDIYAVLNQIKDNKEANNAPS